VNDLHLPIDIHLYFPFKRIRDSSHENLQESPRAWNSVQGPLEPMNNTSFRVPQGSWGEVVKNEKGTGKSRWKTIFFSLG
jgi:hypothetical protein